MGMLRIEIEFKFDMVFCFGIRLAPYAVFFSTRIYFQPIVRPVESDRPINILFVRPSVSVYYIGVKDGKTEKWKKKAKENSVFCPTIYLTTLKVFTKFEDAGSHRSRKNL